MQKQILGKVETERLLDGQLSRMCTKNY